MTCGGGLRGLRGLGLPTPPSLPGSLRCEIGNLVGIHVQHYLNTARICIRNRHLCALELVYFLAAEIANENCFARHACSFARRVRKCKTTRPSQADGEDRW